MGMFDGLKKKTRATLGEGNTEMWIFSDSGEVIKVYDGVALGNQLLCTVQGEKLAFPRYTPIPVLKHMMGGDFHNAPQRDTSVHAITAPPLSPGWDAAFKQRDVESMFDRARQEREEEKKGFWAWLQNHKAVGLLVFGTGFIIAGMVLLFTGGPGSGEQVIVDAAGNVIQSTGPIEQAQPNLTPLE